MNDTETTAEAPASAAKLTPIMAQYFDIKAQHPDALLFFRMGDFYELFFDDAKTASSLLEIALTARNRTDPDPIPMCGVPHHAATHYINKLVSKGHKVALCEQLEEPAKAKGIVKRGVTQVITPGTQFDPQALDSKTLNLTHAAVELKGQVHFASCDYSTGFFAFGTFETPEAWLGYLATQPVAELLWPDDRTDAPATKAYRQAVPAHYFDLEYATARIAEQFQTKSLPAIHKRLAENPAACRAVGALIKHFQATQLGNAVRIPLTTQLVHWSDRSVMDLDGATLKSLDLTDGDGSLLTLLDRTKTAVGGRLLKSWLTRPLIDLAAIRRRLDDVEAFYRAEPVAAAAQGALAEVYDIERLLARVALGNANARDLRNLTASVFAAAKAAQIIAAAPSTAKATFTGQLSASLTADLVALARRLDAAIADEPPVSVKEGGLFKKGVDPRLDELIDLADHGTQWLARFEAQERDATGIASLKVRFNRVFGYYIEITKSNLAAVPAHYVRKQTMAGAERFITEDLKTYEDKILNAEKRRQDLEQELFKTLCAEIAASAPAFIALATATARVDVIAALARVASERGYVRPEVHDGLSLEIKEGRHPVVELKGGFVPNTVILTPERGHFLFITGPNMGGKSTVMRQTALIALMAQAGSFVPAESARIGLIDRVFTRIGASDNIAAGQSTFMVEMSEMSFILRNATERSLVLLDEVGRGTSTFDGLSLAWALAEELLKHTGCRTLFATHYHELTELAAHHPQALNLQVAVEVDEESHDVRFLYRLEPGAARRSYGIAVARLAGLPPRVLSRAEALLARLESNKARRAQAAGAAGFNDQLGLGL